MATLLEFDVAFGNPSKEATIVVYDGGFENAVWTGDEDWNVVFSYHALESAGDNIHRLPWKLVEVKDDPSRQKKWFKRASTSTSTEVP